MTENVEDILTRGNPWPCAEDGRMRAAIGQTSAAARAAAGRARRRRRMPIWVLPVAGAGVLALTAGAVVAGDLLQEKLHIPIRYTTDTGETVECTAQIVGGSLFMPRRDSVIEYYRTHDFSDVGQRIYDYALVLTGEREATHGVLPQSSEVVPEEGEGWDDRGAFSFSLTSFLLTDTQIALGFSGSGYSSLTSDCTGQLH